MFPAIRCFLILCVVLELGGCATRAFQAQEIAVVPYVAIGETDVGQGRTVAITVVDARPTKVVGRREWALGPSAEITVDPRIAEIVRSTIANALSEYKFVPISTDSDQRMTLDIEIQTIEYSVTQSFTFDMFVQAVFVATAHTGQKVYSRDYRGEVRESAFIVPDDNLNSRLINQAISLALERLVSDVALIKFLASQ